MININKIVFIIALSLSLAAIFGCERDDSQKLDKRNWKLVWSDEFDGAKGASPDSTKWNLDIGNGDNGWGNSELENYTDDTANISTDGNGNLVITAISNGTSFTSGRINSKGLFSQKYGRIEASIKTPYGPGLWPAFWMLGANVDNVSWPQCGEIDIMELRGQKPEVINGTIHGPGYSGGNSITKSYALTDNRYDNNFHLFAVEWDADKIDFFVDDYLYQRITRDDVSGEWVYDQDFYILLNVAVGGNYVGFPTSDTPFPQKMYVDYIRVYTEI